jgi:hypothetical protein
MLTNHSAAARTSETIDRLIPSTFVACAAGLRQAQAARLVEELALQAALDSLQAELTSEEHAADLEATRAMILSLHRERAAQGDAFALAALQIVIA